MSKVNIKAKLLNKTSNETYNINTKGIKNNNKITFYDNDILNTIIIDSDNILVERKNNEYTISLDFSKEKGIYKTKDDLVLDFMIKINYIIKKEEFIEIDYIIYMDDEISYNYTIDCRC